jgi:hypothetical protein
MPDRDWDKELARIDKNLESASDQQMFPTQSGAGPTVRAEVAATRARTSTLPAVARLVLATALGVGILFWPYDARCGFGLAAYLGAVAVVILSGVWSGVWTWRHHTGRAHILSLLLILWGIVLGAREILPRSGYARPTLDVPAGWTCG